MPGRILRGLWLLLLVAISGLFGTLIANIAVACIGLTGWHPQPEFLAGWWACWLFYWMAFRIGQVV